MTTSTLRGYIPARIRYVSPLLLFYLFCATPLFAFGDIGFSLKDNKRMCSVPFTVVNNLIVIEIELNDKKKVKAVFDTGIRSVVLFGSVFKRNYDFSHTRKVMVGGLGSGRQLEGELSINNLIEIGDVEGNGVGIVHVNKVFPFEELAEAGVTALIGYQLFSSFVVEIDYRNQRVMFYDPDTYIPYHVDSSFPLQIIDTKPYISTSLSLSGGEPCAMKLLLDTGAEADLILYRTNENLLKGLQKETKTIGLGLSGHIRGKSKTSQLQLGKINLGEREVHQLSAGSAGQIAERFQVDGLVGANILQDFVVTFDYIHKRVYFSTI